MVEGHTCWQNVTHASCCHSISLSDIYAAICASPTRLVTFLLRENAKMYADIQNGNTDLSVFIFVTLATCLVAKLERDLWVTFHIWGGKKMKIFFSSSLSQSLLLNISFVSFLWKIWLRVPLRKREVLLLGTLCCLALHTAPFACNQRSAPSVFTFPVTARGRTRSAGLSLWQRRDQRSGMKDTRGTVQVLLSG